jgi:hypothetical protein
MHFDEPDDETDETVIAAASQRRVTTQSRFGTASSITFDLPYPCK